MFGWKKVVAVALLAVAGTQVHAATLSTTATPNPALPGQAIELDVRISDVNDLYSYYFSLDFDPSILNATSSIDGGFVTRAGTSRGHGGAIDNPYGKIWFAGYTLIGPINGSYGSGSLLRVTFDAVGAGISPVNITDVVLLDSLGQPIAYDVVNTTITSAITAVPEPSTWLMLGAGLLGVAALRHRDRLRLRPLRA